MYRGNLNIIKKDNHSDTLFTYAVYLLHAYSRHNFNCIGAILSNCLHRMYILFRKKIIHGSHTLFAGLTWVGMILVCSSRTRPWGLPIRYCQYSNSQYIMASTIYFDYYMSNSTNTVGHSERLQFIVTDLGKVASNL